MHIGPSDHVPWLDDRKLAFVRLEGKAFGDVPLNLEYRLEVWDSPNSAGVIIDAIRAAKIARDRGIGGPVLSAASYFMKSPPEQYGDDVARDMVDKFIRGEVERSQDLSHGSERAPSGVPVAGAPDRAPRRLAGQRRAAQCRGRRASAPGRVPPEPLDSIARSAFVSDLRMVLAERNFRRLFATRLISQTGDGIVTAGVGTYVFFNASTFTSPTAAAAALHRPVPAVLADRPVRRGVHRPLVAAPDPGPVRAGPLGLRGGDRGAHGRGRPRGAALRRRSAGAGGEPVLPGVAVGGAAARGGRGQAGHGQLGVPDRGRHHGRDRGHRRPRPERGHRRHRARRRHHPAGRRRLLRGRQPGRHDHAAGTCSARCASRGHRRGGCSASWPRSRPNWPRPRGTRSRAAARRPRSAPPAAASSCSGSCP